MSAPRVRILSPRPVGRKQFIAGVGTRVYINDVEWDSIESLKVELDVNSAMMVTMRFYADATIEHVDADERTPNVERKTNVERFLAEVEPS